MYLSIYLSIYIYIYIYVYIYIYIYTFFFFFVTLHTGPSRSLRLKLRDTEVYAPYDTPTHRAAKRFSGHVTDLSSSGCAPETPIHAQKSVD